MPSEFSADPIVAPIETAGLTIDGVAIGPVLAPADPVELAGALAAAGDAGQAVYPVGGGTALALGNIPEREGIALSTRHLDRVLDYEPADLVVSVEAGISLAALQRLLGEHGQWLPVEAPWPERATLGGMIATARAGPRRHGSGTMRDLLVGMVVSHPNGSLTRSGGMVVKNVSGFDMPRLYHGSLGTLGVIVSANLKVLPLPKAGATVVIDAGDLDTAKAVVGRLRPVAPDAVALEAMMLDGRWRVAVRFEGRAAGVDRLVSLVVATAGAPASVLMNRESASWWQDALDAFAGGPDEAVEMVEVAATVRPRDTMALVDRILHHCRSEGGSPELVRVSPGVGIVAFRWDLAGGDHDRASRLIGALRADSDHTVIRSAPAGVKRLLDVWGPAPETIDIQRALKRHFDPDRVLNPGRFLGRI
ncbi:MAG: FAD-binding oxidoreductase [Chloroflexota bacterium]|nr:FAD-binding oxidoreductase [Chloroflexota bacterium]